MDGSVRILLISSFALANCASPDVASTNPPPDEVVEWAEPSPAGVDHSQLELHEAASAAARAMHEGPPLQGRLASGHIKAGLAALRYPVNVCATEAGVSSGERVDVSFSIDGPSGTVRHAVVEGKFAETDFGECVRRACQDATFARFEASEQSFKFGFALRASRE